jgi:high-affinity Fe2+/Pb2+ permease
VRPDALSSDALPLREGADASFSFAPSFATAVVAGFAAVVAAVVAAGLATGFAVGFVVDFEVEAPAGGFFCAILFYRTISLVVTREQRAVAAVP